MVSIISSCSSLLTPMLASASRVPQSGQISVWLSSLERAGVRVYPAPHFGQILILNVSVFISCLLHRPDLCLGKIMLIKSETDITFKACSYIGKGRNPDFPLFVHDIHKAFSFSYFSCPYSLDIQFHILFCNKKQGILHNGQVPLHLLR